MQSFVFIVVFFSILVTIGANISIKSAAFTVYTNPLLFEFLFGGLIARIYMSGFRFGIAKSLVLIFVSFLLYGFLQYFSATIPAPWIRVTTWGIPTAFFVAGWIFLEAATHDSIIWKSKIGAWFGNISYSVYLTHYAIFVFACTPTIIEWSRDGGSMGQFALAGYLLSIILLISSVLYVMIEKPISNLFARRGQKIEFA